MLRKLDTKTKTKLAKVGATVSRQCRNCWTGEQIRVSVRLEKLIFGGRNDIALLEILRLLALEDVADLSQARLVRDGQHSWTQEDWLREIEQANS